MDDIMSEKLEHEDEMEDLRIMEEDRVLEMFGEWIGTLLIEDGYDSIEAVTAAADAELLDITGIGKTTLRKIREQVPVISGVSDQPATVASEVKPVSTEAEAAEEIAETSSADEASTADLPSGDLIAIRSLWPARMRISGPSGMVYEFNGAGAQVNVKREDAEFVMSKNRNVGRACCGSSGERLYYEIV